MRLAQQHALDAYVYLELARDGVGRAFDQSLDELFERLADSPMQFPAFDKDLRRAIVRRFKYVVVFEVSEDTVSILAIFHGARDVSTWREC